MGWFEESLGLGAEQVAEWARNGVYAAKSCLDDVADILTGNPDEARARAAESDRYLFELRCSILAMAAIAKEQTDDDARSLINKEIAPYYRKYVEAASAMYGSVSEAREHYESIGGCSAPAVGFLPALPVAAWYAAGAAVSVASIAYAYSWSVSGKIDVANAEASTRRMEALSECVKSGAPAGECARLGTPTQAEANDRASRGLGDQLKAAGEGAGAAAEGSGAGVAIAALGVAALVGVLVWGQK